MDDTMHVNFSSRLGDLDNIRRFITGNRKMRYQYYELFDAGNVDENGQLVDPNSARAHANLGNRLFHADSTYNPRRASYSLLRAVEIPPAGNGGNTEFADTRTAFSELPDDLREELVAKDYVGAHTFAQSRRLGSPEYFADLDPNAFPMARHKVAQVHEPSGRTNLYIGAHLYGIEGVSEGRSAELRDFLNRHATQDKYVVSVEWTSPGDMIIWDNRSTLHRAMGGTFEGKYRRDLRRTTVHDDSSSAWGLNPKEAQAVGFQLANLKETKLPPAPVTAPTTTGAL
jgi:alpha-ketoglutarate-dependent 2,4-dichlorophenoxyacetate dioxygenase